MKLVAPIEKERELHPAGVFSAVCVDVIDLGEVKGEYGGKVKNVRKVRLVWETEVEGGRKHLGKTFTASLHSKATLAKFLGQWRGRTVVAGEEIDMAKVIGAGCTLVISHQVRLDGQGDYASIDAISRPTKTLKPSGSYDGVEERKRWKEIMEEKRGEAARVAVEPEAEGEAEVEGEVAF